VHALFCLPDFEPLGVQRVVASLARAWPAQEARLSICVHRRAGPLLETLPREVAIVALDELAPDVPKLRVLARPLLHLAAIRRLRADVAVGFVPGDNLSLLAARALGGRFGLIVSEHIHVSSQLRDYPLRFRAPYRALFPRWYPRADAICVVAEESREDLVANFGIPRARTHLIRNPLDLDAVRAGAREPAGHPWFDGGGEPVIVAAGRLERQKRVDLLLRALASLRRSRAARLVVLGDGPLRAELEGLAGALGIAEHVWFAGFVPNPWRYMARARAFALASDYEGFPCALAEAMALGVPAVATDCPSGPREMMGEAGLLVPVGDGEALAAALRAVLEDGEAAAARARKAQAAAERFEARGVARRYLELIRGVAGARS